MALRNTSWDKVEAGQIVNFIYKSKKEAKGSKRTVIIINSDYKYRKKSTGRIKRFVVGLQIDVAGKRPLAKNQLNQIFESFGGMEIEGDSISVKMKDDTNRNKMATEKTYQKMRNIVNRYDMWRTYDRRECAKRRVYLEVDYNRVPEDIIDSFEKEQSKKIMEQLEYEN